MGYKPALHGIFAYVQERGKEKVEEWALMQEPASTWWSIGRGTCMEVVRNRETHAGRSVLRLELALVFLEEERVMQQ